LILGTVALVKGHGNGAGKPRVEVSKAAHLPIGMPFDPDEPAVPPTPYPPHSSQNADPSPDLAPGGVLGPGAPPATIPAEQIFPTREPENLRNAKGKHKFQKGNSFARLGGAAKKDTNKLLNQCGIPETVKFKSFKALAQSFHKFHVARLARDVGGGECGPAPALMVKFASHQAASAEYLYREAVKLLETPGEDCNPLSTVTGLFESSSKLQNASRQNLLAAHELCAKEAQSRRNKKPGKSTALEEAFGEYPT
jgi:hypothetical protein